MDKKESGTLFSTLEELFPPFLSCRFSLGNPDTRHDGSKRRKGSTKNDSRAKVETGAEIAARCIGQGGTGPGPSLKDVFSACVGLIESRGMVRRLRFGGYVLLQPELLDSYASAIVNAARAEPQGFGCINETSIVDGTVPLFMEGRASSPEHEKILLLATVEELLSHEVALRENTDSGASLVFPSQFTRERHDVPDVPGQSVCYRFEGAIQNIYAMLAVRLSRSDLFVSKEMWKGAATFESKTKETCGFFLREDGEGSAELTLFFGPDTASATMQLFEEYVRAHLVRRARPNSIQRIAVIKCLKCNERATPSQVKRRKDLGYDFMTCSVCDSRIPLLDRTTGDTAARGATIQDMDASADHLRSRELAVVTINAKQRTGDYDVFLCYNTEDRNDVTRIAGELRNHGILPWLDIWELRPGLPWQRALEEQISKIRSAAVFVGGSRPGPWQLPESDAFIRQFLKRKCPVIPVLLNSFKGDAPLPIFLEGMMWVDWRKTEPDPLDQLMWGITGERFNER